MKDSEVMQLDDGTPVKLKDGNFGMLIRFPADGDKCGIQVPGEDDIRWIESARLEEKYGALVEVDAPASPTAQMNKLRAIANAWNKLKRDDKHEWDFLIKHKEYFVLLLDNDHTGVDWNEGAVPSGVERDDLPELSSLRNDIGNRCGVVNILKLIGIKAEFC